MSSGVELDRRAWPTRGVAALFGAALVDLALLPFRVVAAIACADARRRDVADLIHRANSNATKDANPPR
jgi:hypothetical protein